MEKLTVSDASTIVLGLQDEIRRSDEAKYDHRLHGVLLVAQGMSCREVAGLLGDSPRTVQYWIRRFEENGLGGLVEGDRVGRPGRLNNRQIEVINKVLRQTPSATGLTGNLWDGKTLSRFIEHKFNISLGARQCQRIFRQLGFRLRKPRPMVANPDPERQKAYKKTPSMDTKPPN